MTPVKYALRVLLPRQTTPAGPDARFLDSTYPTDMSPQEKQTPASSWSSLSSSTKHAMRTESQTGFTVVEVILFLALAGLVFVIGFAGIGGRNQEVQFTDSIRSMDSFLQGNLNDVVSGSIRENVSSMFTDGDTVYLGKYVAFCTDNSSHSRCSGANGARVWVYDVVGNRLSDDLISDIVSGTGDCGQPHSTTDVDVRLLDCSQPRVVGEPESENVDWGTHLLGANRGVHNYSTPGYGFLKSPNSQRVVLTQHYKNSAATPSDTEMFNLLEGGTNAMFDSSQHNYAFPASIVFCFQGSNDRYAVITAGFHERQVSIETEFDPIWYPENPRTDFGGQLPNACGQA